MQKGKQRRGRRSLRLLCGCRHLGAAAGGVRVTVSDLLAAALGCPVGHCSSSRVLRRGPLGLRTARRGLLCLLLRPAAVALLSCPGAVKPSAWSPDREGGGSVSRAVNEAHSLVFGEGASLVFCERDIDLSEAKAVTHSGLFRSQENLEGLTLW